MTASRTFDLLGAHLRADGLHLGVWAPKPGRVEAHIETPAGGIRVPMAAGEHGVWTLLMPDASAGTRYGFVLDGEGPFPDPRSRSQPDGVHALSEVIDPAVFEWNDAEWQGLDPERLSIYELHIGTYTKAGTYTALIEELPHLLQLGITTIELMPVNEFPGRWGWGYDGVGWYAPTRAYGTPDELRRLIDAAHGIGLGVILDVVFNHFGPAGNYYRQFSDDHFTDRHITPWGDGINYDGPGSDQVRALVLDCIEMWLREYHIDGFRLDAADFILDESSRHILTEISERAAAVAPYPAVVIAEDAQNDLTLIHPRNAGGKGMTAAWADDFHHELHVFLTGDRESYYSGFEGRLASVATIINEGSIYQGQVFPLTGMERGMPITDEPARGFVFCIQNHDQIGNRPFGDRLHHQIDLERYLVASAVLLFSPQTPLLFMGQEFAASTPFQYFSDHEEELGRLVTEGRRKEFAGFRAFGDADSRDFIPDPQAESTFLASKLDPRDRDRNAGVLALYRDLLHLRHDDPVLRTNDRTCTRAFSIGPHLLLVHRWTDEEHRLLVANFDHAVSLPLPADPGWSLPDCGWRPVLTTSAERYGGPGDVASLEHGTVTAPARRATVLARSS